MTKQKKCVYCHTKINKEWHELTHCVACEQLWDVALDTFDSAPELIRDAGQLMSLSRNGQSPLPD